MQARETGSPLLPKPVDQFRDYEHADEARRGVLPPEPHAPDARLRAWRRSATTWRSTAGTMTVFEALEYLNTLVDDSDPDVDFTQIEHALQTAEAIRAANQPRWFIVTGLVHDLGKILCLFGEPQWAVVGDTFPVGCRWSPKIVHRAVLRPQPRQGRRRATRPRTASTSRAAASTTSTCRGATTSTSTTRSRTTCRMEALYMLRYHSFYPWHKENEYDHLTNETDRAMVKWVRAFNRYDLYSKGAPRPKVDELMPYYEDLVKEFFPEPLNW